MYILTFLVCSFIELTKLLLELDGVEYFLSEKLNQDPLEECFGHQRMKGESNSR